MYEYSVAKGNGDDLDGRGEPAGNCEAWSSVFNRDIELLRERARVDGRDLIPDEIEDVKITICVKKEEDIGPLRRPLEVGNRGRRTQATPYGRRTNTTIWDHREGPEEEGCGTVKLVKPTTSI